MAGKATGITSNAAEALAVFFERGFVALPARDETGDRWLFANAEPLPAALADFKAAMACEQGFRPEFLALEKSGYEVSAQADLQAGQFAGAVFMVARSRKANERDLARCWAAVRSGGPIIVAGGSKSGVEALEKWAGRMVEIAGHFSKYHARVFWMVRSDEEWPVPTSGMHSQSAHAAPGMFSADGPDTGSETLARHFDGRIKGLVADFGAGWGYLGAELLKSAASLTRLDCYEADWKSLRAAESNLAHFHSNAQINFFWRDVTSEPIGEKYDWIVMNPPFHVSRAAEPEIGAAFIERAASALKQGGQLLMVANRNLPYERTLATLFDPVRQIEESNGFKIIEAVRRARPADGRRMRA